MKKITLNLTENQYIDLVEAIDLAINNVMKNSIYLMNKCEPNEMSNKLLVQHTDEYDSYMTIRAQVIR